MNNLGSTSTVLEKLASAQRLPTTYLLPKNYLIKVTWVTPSCNFCKSEKISKIACQAVYLFLEREKILKLPLN